MAALFVSDEFLTEFEPPPLRDDARFFVIARNGPIRAEGDHQDWFEDRTRVTNSITIAALWALALSGAAEDGSNPQPLARVTAFAVDPLEARENDAGELEGEHVVLYVSADGDILAEGTEGFDSLHSAVREWPEIIKSYAESHD
jgi:hypothetical protein